MLTIFGWNFEIWAVQNYVNLVDRVKSFPTSIYLQKSASIEPRTSLSKFGGKFNSLFIRLLTRYTPSGIETIPNPGSGALVQFFKEWHWNYWKFWAASVVQGTDARPNRSPQVTPRIFRDKCFRTERRIDWLLDTAEKRLFNVAPSETWHAKVGVPQDECCTNCTTAKLWTRP